MTERVFDEQAEAAVLSACMISPLARRTARESLSRGDFYSFVHEQIWVAMEELDAAGRPVDATTLASILSGQGPALRALPDIATAAAVPEHVTAYAETVRGWAVRRRVYELATRLRQVALNPEANPFALTSQAVTRFTEMRDSGISAEIQSELLADLLAEADDPYDWAVRGLLERRDRIVFTGEEGLGKSYLARQVGIFASAGIHPFTLQRIDPVRVHILDYENSRKQIRRASRKLYDYACRMGEDPRPRIHVAALPRIDITRDKDLSMIHRELDVSKADVVIVGPLYRLTNGALQTDDDAGPVLAALDTLRERGCSLIIEAHAGHSRDGEGRRDLRPRGSSALLGWPEFGYGMRRLPDGRVRMVPWRGDRDERGWPQFLRRAADPVSSHYLPDLSGEVA